MLDFQKCILYHRSFFSFLRKKKEKQTWDDLFVQSVSFPHGIFSYQNVSICLGCLWCATEHFFIFSLNDFTVLFKMTRTFHLAYKILSFSLSAASFIFCTKSQVNSIKYALNKLYPLPVSKLEDFNAKKKRRIKKPSETWTAQIVS